MEHIANMLTEALSQNSFVSDSKLVYGIAPNVLYPGIHWELYHPRIKVGLEILFTGLIFYFDCDSLCV